MDGQGGDHPRTASALSAAPQFPRTNQLEKPQTTGGTPAGPILLVDDDLAVLEALRRVLHFDGWNVVTASSGEAALQYLQTHEVSLLITDLSMAAVSGWDLLFHENLQRPNLPIFVITALPPSSVGGADRFAHEFFPKPVDLDALLAAVRRYLRAAR